MDDKPIIQLHDRKFRLLIPYARLDTAVRELAGRINRDYAGRETPLFLGVLNGSFMFMAELMKHIAFDCEVSFIKLASYEGAHSTGKVRELIGLSNDLRGRNVIVVEDMVDTGESIEHLLDMLSQHDPASVTVAAMFLKPEVYRKDIAIDYYAMTVPARFIIGFGLDYDQLGRNLKDIYEAVE